MCLRIRKTFWNKVFKPKYKTTKEDIKVWKFLRPDYYNESYTSPFRNTLYRFDEEYKSKLGELQGFYEITYRIEEGLHSFYSLYEAKNSSLGMQIGCKLFEAIIPKGSKYIKGDNGEIVSDTIIITNNQIFKSKF